MCVSSWSSVFAVRGACFSGITLGRDDIGEICALKGKTLASLLKLKNSAVFPLTSRHLRGACFHCGIIGHLAKDCPGALELRRVWSHSPAEFNTLGDGIYWDRSRECWVREMGNPKKPRTFKPHRAYVRADSHVQPSWTVTFNGTRVGAWDSRADAVQEAREHLAQLGEGRWRREYSWLPRS